MQPPSLGPIRLFTMESVFGDADAPIVVELAQNQIYRAFREVGRVMRTVALLRFLADSGLRARVTAATNKAEAYNGFSAWTPVRQPGRDRRERPGRAGKVGQMELAAVQT
jgi:Tn3 transposase DDE domain